MNSEKIYRPLFREIPFQDPVGIYEKLKSKNSVFLESAGGPPAISRYSFICIDPYLVFKVKNGVIETEVKNTRSLSFRSPLKMLRELITEYRQEAITGLPPFQGGAVGMFSYDFVRYLERIPSQTFDDLEVPDAHFFFIDRVVAFDHMQKRCWIIVCPEARETGNAGEAEYAIEQMHRRILNAADRRGEWRGTMEKIPVINETGKARYMEIVRKAKEYISAGDIFQANLSLRFCAEIGEADPWAIYKTLKKINPSPFSSFADFGGYQVAGSSPERLVRSSGRIVDTRPIAGTRPRGNNPSEDELLRAELLLNEKERAEHIMLIDLERNDLGRVSDYGTVHVDELMVTERYSHVMHIVSNVKGILAEGKDCFDLIKAAFPGGTITGVPKVRCMQIIDELEPKRRGAYTGSLGYIGFNGNMDLNIIIRTFLIKEGRAYIQAGAGIVADSDPEREYYESLRKAEALIRALECVQGLDCPK